MRNISICVAAVAAVALSTAHAQETNWSKVDAALGRSAAVTGDVHRYGFPRSDLHVRLDGVSIKPALAIGGWVAFKPMDAQTIMMGDLVLLESEIDPVMTAAQQNGLTITAVHNHILRAVPATLYMHVSGKGEPERLASALHDALAHSKTPMAAPTTSTPPATIDLDTAALDNIVGVKGKNVSGVYQLAVPRNEQVSENGMPLTPAAPLELATGINFQPTGSGKAAITGDFVLTAGEVNPVIAALHANGIEVTALHSHMLDDQPRLFFMHFWANDDALKLARGMRAALDKTGQQTVGNGAGSNSAR